MKILNRLPIKNLTTLFFLVTVCFWSCSKDDSNKSLTSNSDLSLLKEMKYYDSIGNFIMSQSFSYNPEGRIVLSKVYYPANYDTVTIRYEYNTSKVIESHYDTSNVLRWKYIYELNEMGLATSRTQVDYLSSSDSTVRVNATYSYNTDGFMIESTYFLSDTLHWLRMNYQISGGNIISQQLSDEDGPEPVCTFTYYPNSVNTIGNNNSGITWMGKSSKELVKTSSYVAFTSDSLYYFYSFDSANRVAIKKIREQHPSVGDVDLRISYY